MDRTTLAPIASHMMDAALRNLVNDGHVAFATMIIKDNAITPILLDSTDSANKEAFGNFLRTLSLSADHVTRQLHSSSTAIYGTQTHCSKGL